MASILVPKFVNISGALVRTSKPIRILATLFP